MDIPSWEGLEIFLSFLQTFSLTLITINKSYCVPHLYGTRCSISVCEIYGVHRYFFAAHGCSFGVHKCSFLVR